MNNVYKVKSAGNSYVIVNGLDGSTVPDSLCHNYPTARAIVKSMNKQRVSTRLDAFAQLNAMFPTKTDIDAYLLSNPKRIGCNY